MKLKQVVKPQDNLCKSDNIWQEISLACHILLIWKCSARDFCYPDFFWHTSIHT